MRAYGYNRPLGMGTYPKGYKFVEIVNFPCKQWVEEVERECFGYVWFIEDVPTDMLEAYELITSEMHEKSKPKTPPENVMRKMVKVYRDGDMDELGRMYDVAERKGYDMEATDSLLAQMLL